MPVGCHSTRDTPSLPVANLGLRLGRSDIRLNSCMPPQEPGVIRCSHLILGNHMHPHLFDSVAAV
jgi:hypothetical protein